RVVIRLGRRHVGLRTGYVVGGLVQRLLGFKVLACQRAGPGELELYIFEARLGFGDLSLQRIDLLMTDAGIDVVAVRGRGGQRRARLIELRRQFHGVEFRQYVARAYLVAFLDRNRDELAVHLRLDPDFRRAHDADNGAGRFGTTLEINHGTAGK